MKHFLRRLRRLTDRDLEGRGEVARSVSAETQSLVGALRRGGAEAATERVAAALLLLEELPGRFHEIDDRYGLLVGPLEQLFRCASELAEDLAGEDAHDERDEFLERLFGLWTEDETGFLAGLGEALMDCVVDERATERVERLCHHFLRDAPVVFPAAPGRKLDLHRSILEADRYRVERIQGELLARRGRHEYAITVAAAHRRRTGDAVDLLRVLVRAGRHGEALEAGRRALRDPSTPRRGEVDRLYRQLLERSDSSAILARELDEFVREPTWDRWTRLREFLPESSRAESIRAALGEAEKAGRNPTLVFELYLVEGYILEADGLATTHPIDAHTLATAAESVMDRHPDRAAGWLLMAAHRLVKRPHATHYEVAADWLDSVRDAAEATGQSEAFGRAIGAFRDLYRRRPALLRALDARGLH
ncbi:MAG: hypothetical protein R3F20_19595 [Planctomycetota bacterium]